MANENDSRGKEFGACFSCPEFQKCNTGTLSKCLYNTKLSQNDLRWTDYNDKDEILGSLTYEQIITALHQEKVKDKDSLIKIVTEMLSTQVQDMWYLVELNMDSIIDKSK